jgi:hypothetical protein
MFAVSTFLDGVGFYLPPQHHARSIVAFGQQGNFPLSFWMLTQIMTRTRFTKAHNRPLENHGTEAALGSRHHRPTGANTMTTQPRIQPQSDELPKDVQELMAAIGLLPAEYRSRLEPILARVVDSTKRRRRILNLVQEALSQLRLDMKYLVFDLEATRRERDAMRQSRDEDRHDEDHRDEPF